MTPSPLRLAPPHGRLRHEVLRALLFSACAATLAVALSSGMSHAFTGASADALPRVAGTSRAPS